MFFCHEILQRKTGSFGIVWLAAMQNKTLTRREYERVHITKNCKDIIKYIKSKAKTQEGNTRRFSLYLSAQLMYGTVSSCVAGYLHSGITCKMDTKSTIDPEKVQKSFLKAAKDSDHLNHPEVYMVVRLPESGAILIKECVDYMGPTKHAEEELIDKLRKELGQQSPSCQTPQHVSVYYSSYNTCSTCVQKLSDFVEEMRKNKYLITINVKVAGVSGTGEMYQLWEARSLWKSVKDVVTSPALILQSFENITQLIEVLSLITKSSPGEEPELTHSTDSIKQTLQECEVTSLKIQGLLGKFDRSTVFKVFHDSNVHKTERTTFDNGDRYCVVKLPYSEKVRVYMSSGESQHAEKWMIKDLRDEIKKMAINQSNPEIRSSKPEVQKKTNASQICLTIYQSHTPCKDCCENVLIPFIGDMRKEGCQLKMKIKAVGLYEAQRKSCTELRDHRRSGICRGSEPLAENVLALANLNRYVQVESFSQGESEAESGYETWKALVSLLNESADCYPIGHAIKFYEEEYKTKFYLKSREEEDRCLKSDFNAVMRREWSEISYDNGKPRAINYLK